MNRGQGEVGSVLGTLWNDFCRCRGGGGGGGGIGRSWSEQSGQCGGLGLRRVARVK
jgi:hypothetical protein